MPDFDSVLHPDFLIPMVPERQILKAHSVALRDGRIAAILPREDARLMMAVAHRPARLRADAGIDQRPLPCLDVAVSGVC